jgi:hypothetical protein
MPASLPVAARWPLQHPSCRHRHRCRLHGPRQSASHLVDREERPSYTFLTFDAPNTWPRISCCQEDPLPPLGLSGAPPPMCPRASTPPSKLGFRPRYADHGSRSVPVGSHHFDGLLRGVGSGPVASRYRTWGSLGFREARRHRPKTARTRSTFPPAPHPSKVCSSSVAVPHRWGPLPPDRSDPKRRRTPPDG